MTAKVEDYYGFVIRRLAAAGSLPEGFGAEIPQAPPPVRAKPLRSSSGPVPDEAEPPLPPEAALARDSASTSRQTEAE